MSTFAIPAKPIILAVDDDPIVLNTVFSTLRNDYTVIPLSSAKAALKYLETKTADLLLLDLVMPEMSGFALFDVILKESELKEIPVIFLTGSIDGTDEANALQMGAVDYIMKPIRPQALLTRISVQLELHNYRKNLEKLVEDKTQKLREALKLLKIREDVTLNLLARVTELRDCDTGSHIERTTEFVKIIVDDLLENPIPGYELTEQEAQDIIKSAKLHDLGKIAVPDQILLKPGKLTPEEFEAIKKHTEEGEKLLAVTIEGMKGMKKREITEAEGEQMVHSDNFLKTARDITYYHHEKWSGEGYPQGLKETEIPLSARIVAIADVYDALRSERPYKEAFDHDKSADIITKDSGKHFDPRLVEIFNKHGSKFDKIFDLF